MSGAVVGAAACTPELRAKLATLRAEAVQRATRERVKCARSEEWQALSLEVRALLLFVSGIDGEPDQLARRAWREMPVPEREAIRTTMRNLSDMLKRSPALLARWDDA